MRIFFALGSGMLLSISAAQAEAPDLAAAFGAREGVLSASLSPDGNKIALIASSSGQATRLFIVDAAAGATPKPILFASGKPEKLYGCNWAANTRLVCKIGGLSEYLGDIYGFSTVVSVDVDGQNQRVLSTRRGADAIGFDLRGGSVIDYLPDEDGNILMMRSYVPEARIGSLVEKTTEGMGVDRIDTRTGAAKRVEGAQRDAVEYITDGYGEVRIKGVSPPTSAGYDKGAINYVYRAKGSRDWRPLSTYVYRDHSGFNPYAVDRDTNLAYGLEKIDGRLAAVSYSLDGTLKSQLLYRHPSVDVDGLVRVGRRGRVIGITYATDKREAVYFDPAMKNVTAALSKALGGRSVYIADTSTDETKLLLWAGSDVDPGQYYLFDKTARKLSPIIPQRPQLTATLLANVQPVTYPAADGTLIPAYLTLPPGKDAKGLPAIVLPHGGPSARDEWGFDWLSQYFVARGFAVIQPNFRGSAGYGDSWFQKNGFRSWETAVGDVASAGKYLVAKGIADPAKLTILGWSYGGYAALQAAVIEPQLFKAVVAIAPVTDLVTLLQGKQYYASYYLQKEFIGSGPHIVAGSPARNVARITAPVLMFQGTLDANVPAAQAKLMDEKMKEAGKRSELVIFEGLDHQLDDEAARTTILKRAGDFLMAAGK
jgi:dipeptidyl aminopeptidase/acylaminoacyl peptidase